MNEHYTIPLPPVTKKNSAQVVHTGQKCPVCRRGKTEIFVEHVGGEANGALRRH